MAAVLALGSVAVAQDKNHSSNGGSSHSSGKSAPDRHSDRHSSYGSDHNAHSDGYKPGSIHYAGGPGHGSSLPAPGSHNSSGSAPAAVHISRAPNVFIHPGPGFVRPIHTGGLVDHGYRYGYYHYNRHFRDDHFFFGFYVFEPFGGPSCYCSPWYYYPCLPPYLAPGHVVIVDSFYSTGWVGRPYAYTPVPVNPNANKATDLDFAVQDIVAAFQDDDRRALGDLVPKDGKVNIFTEGNYSYSLGADEFYDLYKDGIENVHTQHYSIEKVETSEKGDVRVLARHDYTDPWDQEQTVYHTYYLVHEGQNYVIREFGTSYYDKGW